MADQGNMRLSPDLEDAALRLCGARPDEWLCPVCGDVVRDDVITERPPVHEHYDRTIEFVGRPQL